MSRGSSANLRTIEVLMPVRKCPGRILAGIHDELVAANHVPLVLWPRITANLRHASYLQPSLTTLRQSPEKVEHPAARVILERLDGKLPEHEPKRIRIEPELVVRGSTAKPTEDS